MHNYICTPLEPTSISQLKKYSVMIMRNKVKNRIGIFSIRGVSCRFLYSGQVGRKEGREGQWRMSALHITSWSLSTLKHINTIQKPQAMHASNPIQIQVFYLYLGQSSTFRPAICCCATPAYFIASISTFQVGGRPWPSFHLISPACTAPSSFNGLLWKHASIVFESSLTPSRTALPLPAAFLLTYIRRSIWWSE